MKKIFLCVALVVGISAIGFSYDEAVTPSGIPIFKIGSLIDELVENYMHESTPGLAVVVVKDGEIVFSRGYGYADTEKQISVDPVATVFEYASISKLFVYISVMQLVEKGFLDLDADIHTYLPEDLSRRFNFRRNFTIRDLLNHSAGFGEFYINSFFDAEKVVNEITLQEALLASQPKQIFEPGTASSYSNFGNALLAYVVSHINRQEFAVYERENILDLIGMNNTKNQPDWLNNNAFLKFKAKGYQPDRRGGFNAVPWWYIPLYPAGALNGTAVDLARLAIALMPPQSEPSRLFDSRYTLDLIFSPSYSNHKIMRGTYHGFFRYDGIYPTFGHSGGTDGFASEFAIVPSKRFGVILLTNSAAGIHINSKILDFLLGNSMSTTIPLADNLPDASSVTGNYVRLRRHEGNLLEPFNFLLGTNMRVDAIDENTITINTNGLILTYQQTEPYVFRIISSDGPVGHMAYKIHFKMVNGKPAGISTSGSFDATIQTFSQSMIAFAGGASIAVISTLFFLIMPVIVLKRFLRRKEKASLFNHISNGLLFAGTLFALNFIILVSRILMAVPFIQTFMITPHIWINYILLVLAGLLFAASLVLLKKGEFSSVSHCFRGKRFHEKRKVLYFSTISFLALFIFVLWHWNFFAMI